MSVSRLPVRLDLEQLQRQAKELLGAIHAGDANAIAELREHHPESIDPSAAKLADAQWFSLMGKRRRILRPVARRLRLEGHAEGRALAVQPASRRTPGVAARSSSR